MEWSESKRSFREAGTSTHHLSEFWCRKLGALWKETMLPKVERSYRSTGLFGFKEENHDLAYTLWCTGERELYDMKTDSVQMNNLLGGSPFYSQLNSSSGEAERISSRLDSLLLSLKTCQGSICDVCGTICSGEARCRVSTKLWSLIGMDTLMLCRVCTLTIAEMATSLPKSCPSGATSWCT